MALFGLRVALISLRLSLGVNVVRDGMGRYDMVCSARVDHITAQALYSGRKRSGLVICELGFGRFEVRGWILDFGITLNGRSALRKKY